MNFTPTILHSHVIYWTELLGDTNKKGLFEHGHHHQKKKNQMNYYIQGQGVFLRQPICKLKSIKKLFLIKFGVGGCKHSREQRHGCIVMLSSFWCYMSTVLNYGCFSTYTACNIGMSWPDIGRRTLNSDRWSLSLHRIWTTALKVGVCHTFIISPSLELVNYFSGCFYNYYTYIIIFVSVRILKRCLLPSTYHRNNKCKTKLGTHIMTPRNQPTHRRVLT